VTFARFPTDYTTLPKVSFVIPNLCSDMHDCSMSTGDTWLKNNLGGYATWATTHNSVLIITFDEDNNLSGNKIPTVLYGQPVTAGSSSSTKYTHCNLLRTVEDLAGLTSHRGQRGVGVGHHRHLGEPTRRYAGGRPWRRRMSAERPARSTLGRPYGTLLALLDKVCHSRAGTVVLGWIAGFRRRAGRRRAGDRSATAWRSRVVRR
jgi:Phosphoesterase family